MNNKLQEFIDNNEEMHRVINRVLESDAYEGHQPTTLKTSQFPRHVYYEEDANPFIYAFDRECEKIRTLI